jgi:GntR family transcriptional regulator, transcriptional repressor for pyruvate dehydrogenase complex
MALTDEAITTLRNMIQSGALPPGTRLPTENQLAAQMGLSRGGVREAVKVLEAARVLDVRRGDGTYVTSLEPKLLLEGVGLAVELLRGETLLEVMEVRRLLEPAATGIACLRINDDQLGELEKLLERMADSRDDVEALIQADVAFHRLVTESTGNETLTSLLDGLSSRTVRARAWRGVVEANVTQATLDEHRAIFAALSGRDPMLATAAALVHVSTSQAWLRTLLAT